MYNGRMIEIEIKAHVYDKEKLRNTLKTFAQYQQTVERSDLYYHIPVKEIPGQKPYITARIRTEIKNINGKDNKTVYVTYKKKELSENNIEVNIEKETEIKDENVLISLFNDAGFLLAHKKAKHVEDYITQTVFGNATLELCNIPPLGDFLEIEILSESDEPLKIQNIKEELKKLLSRCEIPESCIEPKYYTQMLSELEGKN